MKTMDSSTEWQSAMARRIADEQERCADVVEEVTHWAGEDPVALALLKLHAPVVDGVANVQCEGCDRGLDAEWAPDWPCRSWSVLAQTLRERYSTTCICTSGGCNGGIEIEGRRSTWWCTRGCPVCYPEYAPSDTLEPQE